MKPKPRTAVLYGGDSREREISRLSGAAVSQALKSSGFDVIDIDVRDGFLEPIIDSGAEVAFLALHGEFGEDGQIQAILEEARIPYTGSGPRAARIAMSKPTTKRLLIENGIATPEFCLAGPAANDAAIARAAEELGYPIVTKPSSDGSSLGISIVPAPSLLADAVAKVRETDACVLLERFIPGRELTVGMFNGRALPPIELRCPGFYDFKAKYTSGRTEYIIQPELTIDVANALEQAAVETYACVGCAGVARVDVRLDDSGVPWILEINTIPGLTATSLVPKAARAAGIEFARLCEMMIDDALQRHQTVTGEAIARKKASA
ncbi:MAG: D-alanine--D-alanine ligase [Planctomycetes bacterium]|nr:D-alanine--D-alanine ligase [Planctomycetota bacterium]